MKAPPRLLLAEDQPDDAELVRWALARMTTCQLDVVPDGEAARTWLLDAADARRSRGAPLPSLLLLDLKLTRVSGLELLRLIRRDSILRPLPVIVYSTTENPGEIDAAYAEGANALLVKPGNHAELLRVMRALCEFWLGTVQLPTVVAPVAPAVLPPPPIPASDAP